LNLENENVNQPCNSAGLIFTGKHFTSGENDVEQNHVHQVWQEAGTSSFPSQSYIGNPIFAFPGDVRMTLDLY
jgi:biotin carboxylase